MRAFSVDTNKRMLLSSKEYTDKKKGETIYSIESSIYNKKTGFCGPVIIDSNGDLEKVGGFDVQSYSLYNIYKRGYHDLNKSCSHQIIDISNYTWQISQSPNYVVNLDTSGVLDISNNLLNCGAEKKYYDLSYVNLII